MTEETVNPKSAYMLVYRRSQPLGEGWALARQLAAPADTHQNQGYTHKNQSLDQDSKQGVAVEEVDALSDVNGGVMGVGVDRSSKNQSMRGPLKKLIQEVGSIDCSLTNLCVCVCYLTTSPSLCVSVSVG